MPTRSSRSSVWPMVIWLFPQFTFLLLGALSCDGGGTPLKILFFYYGFSVISRNKWEMEFKLLTSWSLSGGCRSILIFNNGWNLILTRLLDDVHVDNVIVDFVKQIVLHCWLVFKNFIFTLFNCLIEKFSRRVNWSCQSRNLWFVKIIIGQQTVTCNGSVHSHHPLLSAAGLRVQEKILPASIVIFGSRSIVDHFGPTAFDGRIRIHIFHASCHQNGPIWSLSSFVGSVPAALFTNIDA